MPLPSDPRILAAILAQISDGILVATPDGRPVWSNASARRLHGAATLVGGPEAWGDAFTLLTLAGEPYPFAALPLSRAARGETVADSAWRVRRRDGSERVLAGSATPLQGPDGTPLGAVMVMRDVTAEFEARQLAEEQTRQLEETAVELEAAADDLQRANAALAVGEARLAGIIGSAMDAIVTVDEAQRIVLVNAAAEQLFGWTADELRGQPLERLIPRRFHGAHPGHVRAFGATGVTTRSMRSHAAVPALRRDGTEFPIEASISQVRTEEGRFYTVILRDVTERLAAERAQHEAAGRLALLAEAGQRLGESLDPRETLAAMARLAVPRLADACVVDLQGEDGATRRVAAAGDPADPRVAPLLRPPDAAPAPGAPGAPVADRLVLPLAARGRVLGAATLVRLAPRPPFGPDDRTAADELARRAALAVDNGLLYQEAVTARAHLERLTDDLQDTNDELVAATVRASAARVTAEEASAAKSQFLATMSHELRTPLNAITGYTELLTMGLAGEVSADQREYLDRVARSARHLLGLINEVLDLSRVEAGQLRVELRLGDALHEAREAVALVRPQAQQRGLLLTVAPPADPMPFFGDPDRLRQILVNLLGNAVKFTESRPGAPGRVGIEVGTVRGAAGTPATLAGPGPWVRVVVADTGIGIPADKLGAIFEPFVQVDGGHTRRHGGTGLGLAIARRLARLMGGELTAASTVGVGSTFTLWLPAASARRTPAAGMAAVGRG